MGVTTTVRDALLTIPAGLLNPLIESYEAVLTGVPSHDWQKVDLNAGNLCETTYTILRGHMDGHYAPSPQKPDNFPEACRELENFPSTFPPSVRIQIPRVLVAVYEMHSNRGIGRVGGDVKPYAMDGEFLLRAVQWIVAELVRVFHHVCVAEAQEIVETVSEKQLPVIW
jgi:hypothetical protein